MSPGQHSEGLEPGRYELTAAQVERLRLEAPRMVEVLTVALGGHNVGPVKRRLLAGAVSAAIEGELSEPEDLIGRIVLLARETRALLERVQSSE